MRVSTRVKSQGFYKQMAFNLMAQEIVNARQISEVTGYELTVRPVNGVCGEDIASLPKTPEDRIDMDLAILSTFLKLDRSLKINRPFNLWINIFPSTLLSATVLARLLSLVRTSQHNIVVEITEAEFLTDYPEARRSIRAIQEAGARVVLDDFGSGAASIQSLLELPVDGIKIDRVVFQKTIADQRFMPLIQGTVATAKMLNIPVVIEGIETAKHLSVARSLGADFVQGYFVARPSKLPDTLNAIEFDRQARKHQKAQIKREKQMKGTLIEHRQSVPLSGQGSIQLAERWL